MQSFLFARCDDDVQIQIFDTNTDTNSSAWKHLQNTFQVNDQIDSDEIASPDTLTAFENSRCVSGFVRKLQTIESKIDNIVIENYQI